ncbi:MAG: Lar family restriction alleviation protein [Thermoguttaceae bacterium]|nr:Lar family restriction alleviation protein [Thermoguttaceae bacterium]
MKTIKLKRCPFCGGKAEVIVLGAWSYSYWITCKNGCIKTQRQYDRLGNAVNFWNNRSADAAEDAFIAVETDTGLEFKEIE